jgi:hypothetical protein
MITVEGLHQLLHCHHWLSISEHLFLSSVLNVAFSSVDLKLLNLIAEGFFRKRNATPPFVKETSQPLQGKGM